MDEVVFEPNTYYLLNTYYGPDIARHFPHVTFDPTPF